jgi:hypothetical protein
MTHSGGVLSYSYSYSCSYSYPCCEMCRRPEEEYEHEHEHEHEHEQDLAQNVVFLSHFYPYACFEKYRRHFSFRSGFRANRRA